MDKVIIRHSLRENVNLSQSLHNNVLVIDQSEYIEDRPVPGPFPAFPMTKMEKPWEPGCSTLRQPAKIIGNV
jgi:hypothetical protein